MSATSVGLDPTITVGAILVAIPATIGAWAALKGAREVKSPNGTTTAVAIQDIKKAVASQAQTLASQSETLSTVITNQATHEALDLARKENTDLKIEALTARLQSAGR